jgi:hypothetical protein
MQMPDRPFGDCKPEVTSLKPKDPVCPRVPAENRQTRLPKTACRRLRPFRYLRIPPQDRERVHLVRERVKCGKPSCHCARGLRHGPYIFLRYQYWDAAAGRETRRSSSASCPATTGCRAGTGAIASVSARSTARSSDQVGTSGSCSTCSNGSRVARSRRPRSRPREIGSRRNRRGEGSSAVASRPGGEVLELRDDPVEFFDERNHTRLAEALAERPVVGEDRPGVVSAVESRAATVRTS